MTQNTINTPDSFKSSSYHRSFIQGNQQPSQRYQGLPDFLKTQLNQRAQLANKQSPTNMRANLTSDTNPQTPKSSHVGSLLRIINKNSIDGDLRESKSANFDPYYLNMMNQPLIKHTTEGPYNNSKLMSYNFTREKSLTMQLHRESTEPYLQRVDTYTDIPKSHSPPGLLKSIDRIKEIENIQVALMEGMQRLNRLANLERYMVEKVDPISSLEKKHPKSNSPVQISHNNNTKLLTQRDYLDSPSKQQKQQTKIEQLYLSSRLKDYQFPRNIKDFQDDSQDSLIQTTKYDLYSQNCHLSPTRQKSILQELFTKKQSQDLKRNLSMIKQNMSQSQKANTLYPFTTKLKLNLQKTLSQVNYQHCETSTRAQKKLSPDIRTAKTNREAQVNLTLDKFLKKIQDQNKQSTKSPEIDSKHFNCNKQTHQKSQTLGNNQNAHQFIKDVSTLTQIKNIISQPRKGGQINKREKF